MFQNFTTELLVLALGLFFIGFYGFLTRRNALMAFISIELMLNAANFVLVIFSSQYQVLGGMLLVFVVIVLAAVEAVVGLSLIWLLHKRNQNLDLNWVKAH